MRKNFRIGLWVLTAAVLIFFTASWSFGQKTDKKILIGISKIVSHPALDAVEKGIQDELAANKITADFDLQNANGDINTAASIANKFKDEKVTLAVGIATPTAQALVNGIKDVPVVFSAVTDPVKAGLVTSLSKGEGNVCGVSDLTPVKEQIVLLMKLKKVKRLGHIYSSSEDNAVALAALVKQACKDLGIEYVETTVTKSSEVKQALQTIIGRVDAVYISTDNTVVSALSAVSEVCMDKKVPIMSADPSSAESNEVLAAWGFDYYKMGRATGRMVIDILKGKKPADIPTMFMTQASDIDLFVSLDVAKKLGITVPPAIVKTANTVVENGKVIKK